MKHFLIIFLVGISILKSLASDGTMADSHIKKATISTTYTVEELEKIKEDKLTFLKSLQDLDPLTRAQKFNEFLEEEKKAGRLSNVPSKEEREIESRNSHLESLNLAISNLEKKTEKNSVPKKLFSDEKSDVFAESKSKITSQLKPLLLKRLILDKEHIDSSIEERSNAFSKWDKSPEGEQFRNLNAQLQLIHLQEDLNTLEERLKDLNSEGSQINKFFEKIKDGDSKKKSLIESLNRQIKNIKENLQKEMKYKNI